MNMQQLQSHISEVALENPVIDLEEIKAEPEAEKLRKIEWLSELDEQNRYYTVMKEKMQIRDSLKI